MTYIPSSGGSAPDATSTVKGLVQLTNQLGGSATAPTVVATSLVNPLPPDQGGTGTLTGRAAPRVNTLTASSNTYTPNLGTTDIARIITPTANFTVANYSGSPSDGQVFILRITSGATGYVPTWASNYTSSGVAILPTSALPASKTVTFGFRFDASAAKMVLLGADTTGY